MNYLPFVTSLYDLDVETKNKLSTSNTTISFLDDDLKQFKKVQRIVIKNGDECAVVYVGFMVTTFVYMIEISKLYIETVLRYGHFDIDKNECYIDRIKGNEYVPFFTELFTKKPCFKEACIALHSGYIFVSLQIPIAEIVTQEDFNKRIYGIMRIGLKLYQEAERAKTAEKKPNLAREISAGIKLLLNIC